MQRIKTMIVILLLIAVGGAVCLSDQLQWNDRETCERAAQRILDMPLLISFCSLCKAAPVELWFVKDVDIVSTSTEGLYEVTVSGWKADVSSGITEWLTEAVDFAYVYVPSGAGRFTCLGNVLGLECYVRVAAIDLVDGMSGRPLLEGYPTDCLSW